MLSKTHIKKLINDYIAYTLKHQQRSDDLKVEGVNRQAEFELICHEIETGSYITIAQLLDEFLSSTNTLLDKQSVQYGQLLQDVAHAHLQVVLETGNG